MCWIIFQTERNQILETFNNQYERGLDWIWFTIYSPETKESKTIKIFAEIPYESNNHQLYNTFYTQFNDEPIKIRYFTSDKAKAEAETQNQTPSRYWKNKSSYYQSSFKEKKEKSEYYERIIKDYLIGNNQIGPNDTVFLHHRKASIWHTSMSNVHPFKDTSNRFQIYQNGTFHEIHTWWLLENLNPHWTDTEFLLEYLTRMSDTSHNTDQQPNLMRIKDKLESIKKIYPTASLWVVVVFDSHLNQYLVFSDAERSLYIERGETPNKIKSFSSLNPNNIQMNEYKTEWYFIMDAEWFIIIEEIINENVKKPKKNEYYNSLIMDDYFTKSTISDTYPSKNKTKYNPLYHSSKKKK